MRRRRGLSLPTAGRLVSDEEGRFAQVSLRITAGVVTGVHFDASTCATLIAYCELAAEWVTGLRVAEAARGLRPLELMNALTSVPVERRRQAILAAQAMMAALLAAEELHA